MTVSSVDGDYISEDSSFFMILELVSMKFTISSSCMSLKVSGILYMVDGTDISLGAGGSIMNGVPQYLQYWLTQTQDD